MNISLFADLLGVYFFAVSGCLMAARREFDIVGSLTLGFFVGLGGGIVRDLILGAGTPNAFANPIYLLPVLLAVLSVYVASSRFLKRANWLLIADTAGLALFCITGTTKALNHGMSPLTAGLLGICTAVGGGVIRDVVANETPALFAADELYAVPAAVGAFLTAALWQMGAYGTLSGSVVAMLVFVLRLTAHRRRWKTPLAAHTRSAAQAIRVGSKRA